MARGTFPINSNNPYISGYVDWVETNPDTVGNTSYVTMTAYLRRTNVYSGTPTQAGYVSAWFIIDNNYSGEMKLGSVTIPNNGSYVQVGSWGHTVTHNPDGSKQVAVGYALSNTAGITGLKVPDMSTTLTLDTIPRASQPSLITYPNNTEYVGDMGRTITIHMNSKNVDFRHYIYCVFGDTRFDVAYSVKDSVDWTIPLDLANQVPNALDGWGTINVETYHGTTLIGTGSCWFCAAVPANIVPSIEDVSWAKTSSEPSSWPITQGVSKGIMSITGASGAYGSTIVSYSLTFAGLSSNSSSLEINNVASSGVLKAIAKVVDSRGRPFTKEVDFTVAAYSKPQLSVSVYRSDGSGVEDDSGEYMYVKASVTITAVGDNSLQSLVLQYKKHTDFSYTSIPLVNGTAQIISAPSDYTWDWVVTASDKVYPVSDNSAISTGKVVLDILADGSGIGLGKVAEIPNMVDINDTWTLGFGTVPTSCLISSGTSGMWTYEKYSDGKAICYGSKQYDGLTTPQQWGSGFFADLLDFDAFPSGCFSETPRAFLSIYGNGLRSVQISGLGKDHIHIRVTDMGNEANTATISVYAIGRWK